MQLNDLNSIISLYNDGYSLKQIAEVYPYSSECIRVTLKKHDIKLRKYHEVNHKHAINESFFDQIDSEEKAYFLGFLFADGNVNSKYNAITLKLQNQDTYLLERLAKLITNDNIIYYGEYSTLKFSSHHIKKRLIELGCVPNKTFKIKMPEIDSNLYRHFIRGYFDGDGCINKYKNDFYISIVSTEEMCNNINDIVEQNCGIKLKMVSDSKMMNRGNNITKIIRCSGNKRVYRLANWLYNGSRIYLDRKYKKYELLCNYYYNAA